MEYGLSGGGSLERELTGAGAFLSRLGLYGAWALWGAGSLERGLSGAELSSALILLSLKLI